MNAPSPTPFPPPPFPRFFNSSFFRTRALPLKLEDRKGLVRGLKRFYPNSAAVYYKMNGFYKLMSAGHL